MSNSKVIFNLTLLLFISALVKSQTPDIDILKIKEAYDDILVEQFNDPFTGYLPLDAFPSGDCLVDVNGPPPYADPPCDNSNQNLGVSRFGFYESLLSMYEFTKDKAYLYRFMNEAQYAIGKRGKDPSLPYYWYSGSVAVFNSRITAPLAHFAYLVKKDPILQTTPIFNPANFNGFNTFGDFANWIYLSTLQTLNDILYKSDPAIPNYGTWWLGPTEGIRHGYGTDGIGELNYQAPLGVTLVYMYLASGKMELDFGHKAVQMAQMYLLSPMNCPSLYPAYSVFSVNGNNAYYWAHRGWQTPDCPGNHEDLGHVMHDIQFPLVYNKTKTIDNWESSLTSGSYFDDYQMVRFRNTFSLNIWDSNIKAFHNSVYGDANAESFPSADYYGPGQPCAMAWSPLYKFDSQASSGEDVYNILIDYYKKSQQDIYKTIQDPIYPDKTYNFYDGLRYNGIAHLAESHWEKALYSLLLRNRDLIYDQDFLAKDSIIVDPRKTNRFFSKNMKSVDYPHQIADTVFIVEAKNGNAMRNGATFKAGRVIQFKKGFHAVFGSQMHALIDPSLKIRKIRKGSENQNSNQQFESKEIQSQNIFAFPNPSKGTVTISGVKESSSIKIVDLLGRDAVFLSHWKGSEVEIEIKNSSKGVYFCSIRDKGLSKILKIVVE